MARAVLLPAGVLPPIGTENTGRRQSSVDLEVLGVAVVRAAVACRVVVDAMGSDNRLTGPSRGQDGYGDAGLVGLSDGGGVGVAVQLSSR